MEHQKAPRRTSRRSRGTKTNNERGETPPGVEFGKSMNDFAVGRSLRNVMLDAGKAAEDLDEFLHNDSTHGERYDGNESIAWELQHLHDAEDSISRELMALGLERTEREVDEVGNFGESFAYEMQHLTDAEDELRRELDAFESSNEPAAFMEELNAASSAESQEPEEVPSSGSDVFYRNESPNSSQAFRQLRNSIDEGLRARSLVSRKRALESGLRSFDKDDKDDNDSIDIEKAMLPIKSADKAIETKEQREAPWDSPTPDLTRVHDISNNSSSDFAFVNYREHEDVTIMERLADAVFGRNVYNIMPLLGGKNSEHERTVQGTVCVAMATAVVIAKIYHESPFLPVMLGLLPPTLAWVEVNLPHRAEETTLALGILAVHFGLSQTYLQLGV